jgi:hypothetical protein
MLRISTSLMMTQQHPVTRAFGYADCSPRLWKPGVIARPVAQAMIPAVPHQKRPKEPSNWALRRLEPRAILLLTIFDRNGCVLKTRFACVKDWQLPVSLAKSRAAERVSSICAALGWVVDHSNMSGPQRRTGSMSHPTSLFRTQSRAQGPTGQAPRSPVVGRQGNETKPDDPAFNAVSWRRGMLAMRFVCSEATLHLASRSAISFVRFDT